MGDYFLRKGQSEEEIEKAKNYYQEAIDRDPQYADALAGRPLTSIPVMCGLIWFREDTGWSGIGTVQLEYIRKALDKMA